MLRYRAHSIIAYTCRYCSSYPCGVGEERIETAITAIVEIDVDAAVESEHKVADCVGALDGEGVAVKGGEEPGVFCSNELAGFIVGPELFIISHLSPPIRIRTYLVFVICMQIYARLLACFPL
jgi:hypothetical protein